MKKFTLFLLAVLFLSLPAEALAELPSFVKTGEEVFITDANGQEIRIDTTTPGRFCIPLSEEENAYLTVMNEDADMSVYRDMPKIHWAYKNVRRCVMSGIMGGVSPSKFAPSEYVSRAQFCQMIYNLYKNDTDVIKQEYDVTFSDVTQDMWYYEAVSACASSGIVFGDNGIFNPSAPITRQDTALMFMRIIEGDALAELDCEQLLAKSNENGIAAVDFYETDEYAVTALAASLGVLYNGNEKGEIRPKDNISRAECATIISNYFFDGYEDPAIKKLVYLSPSRQMDNPYKGIDTSEGEQMYIVADYTKAKLEEMGYDVYVADVERLIKYDDCRADEAKALGADVYVAIHSNATHGKNNGSSHGAVCFYNGNNIGSKELAQAVFNRVAALTPTTDNGIENDMLTSIPFAEIRLPEMANILLEVEYHDYNTYAKWIVNNVKNIGETIALGIDDYFKLYNI